MFTRSPCCKCSLTLLFPIIVHNKQAQTALVLSDRLIGKYGRVNAVGYVLLHKFTIKHANQPKKEQQRRPKEQQKREAPKSLFWLRPKNLAFHKTKRLRKNIWGNLKARLDFECKGNSCVKGHLITLLSTTAKSQKSSQDLQMRLVTAVDNYRVTQVR